ncbi:CopG family transcriptional regulator [Streptomyces globisporus]|uniref:CopG family transcriptional regulator n=1 Tax=Streptomyces globisporus TaxID=1908 RepID=A0A423V436_STRGL|nr:CopG family transcriptional regulator [Streptomyces globisporus]ROV69376.1 CopG family transcriptional regulator [Streptomyces globisporus]
MHLPGEWEVRLNAVSSATGVSKAELVRRGIAVLLDSVERPKCSRGPPVVDSENSRASGEMDNSVRRRIKERAARR